MWKSLVERSHSYKDLLVPNGTPGNQSPDVDVKPTLQSRTRHLSTQDESIAADAGERAGFPWARMWKSFV